MNTPDEIPDTWRLIISRENGGWKAAAIKQEGMREIRIHTYDSPQASLGEALALLEKKIKQ